MEHFMLSVILYVIFGFAMGTLAGYLLADYKRDRDEERKAEKARLQTLCDKLKPLS